MSSEIDKDLDTLLRFDSLQRAEEISGKSYKEDENTAWMGMILMQANAKAKEAALTAQNDSVFSNELDRYLEIIATEGFYKIFEMEIPNTNDKFFLYWHDDGILLQFDSYGGKWVDGGNFGYNWSPSEGERESCLSSHDGLRDGVLAGSHDCREAIRFHIRKLRENGKFVVPWRREPPMVSLINRDEYKQLGKVPWDEWRKISREIRKNRIAQLPEHVRNAITTSEEGQ